jgi:hypothetical protein
VFELSQSCPSEEFDALPYGRATALIATPDSRLTTLSTRRPSPRKPAASYLEYQIAVSVKSTLDGKDFADTVSIQIELVGKINAVKELLRRRNKLATCAVVTILKRT